MWQKCWEIDLVSKNVVNLPRGNIMSSQIFLLPKGLNFISTFNRVDKAKLKAEALGRTLRLKWYFRN